MFIAILILILLFFIIYQYHINSEHFVAYQTYQQFIPVNTYKYPFYMPFYGNPYYRNPYFGIPYAIPYWNTYTNFPWNNTRLGNTRNMSYDYRGDPVIIPRTDFAWNNGTVFPIYN